MSDTNNSIPTDDFEFFLQLEDINPNALGKTTREALDKAKAEYVPEETETWDDSPNEVEQYETTDWSFLDNPDGNEIKFSDDEEEESQPEETEDDAPFQEDDTETDSENTDITDYGDTVDIDLDTIITLHGKEYTAEELISRYQEDETFNQRKAEFEAERNAFIQDRDSSKNLLDLSILECDKQIAEYNANFDWDYWANNDPAEYVRNQRYLEAIKHKKENLVNEQARIVQAKEAQEHEAFVNQSRACVQVLESEIPGWNMNLYGNLIQHAVDFYGADEADALKWNKPSVFKMLYDAYCAHNDILKAKASIKRTRTSGGRFVRPGANPTRASNDQAKREAAEKAYGSGKMSQETAFSFLED